MHRPRDVHGRIGTGVQGLEKLWFRLIAQQAVANVFGEDAGCVAIVGDFGDLACLGHFLEFRPVNPFLTA